MPMPIAMPVAMPVLLAIATHTTTTSTTTATTRATAICNTCTVRVRYTEQTQEQQEQTQQQQQTQTRYCTLPNVSGGAGGGDRPTTGCILEETRKDKHRHKDKRKDKQRRTIATTLVPATAATPTAQMQTTTQTTTTGSKTLSTRTTSTTTTTSTSTSTSTTTTPVRARPKRCCRTCSYGSCVRVRVSYRIVPYRIALYYSADTKQKQRNATQRNEPRATRSERNAGTHPRTRTCTCTSIPRSQRQGRTARQRRTNERAREERGTGRHRRRHKLDRIIDRSFVASASAVRCGAVYRIDSQRRTCTACCNNTILSVIGININGKRQYRQRNRNAKRQQHGSWSARMKTTNTRRSAGSCSC